MKVNELRIGNYVHNNVESFPIKAKDLMFLLSFDNEHYAEPIPLTDEWLLKLGYRYYNGKKSGTMCLDFGGKLDIDFHEGKIQVKSHYEEYSMYRPLNHIKFVHQLQNLYFTLTGEELAIRPQKSPAISQLPG